MEQEIQYCTPADGTRIAFSIVGGARTSAGVSFEDKGERNLKGVSDAVRVWAVR